MDREVDSLKVERFKSGFYYNYHKHTHYSNIRTQDCVSKPIDYIKRAIELGHDSYFTTEHGWQGNIFECFTLCQQNNLKCIYGVEAYYVNDMYEQDRSNYHLMLVALNKEGQQEINTILSKANTEGFYYKPRIDLKCLLSLTPGNVIITTACIASPLFKGANWEEKFLKPVLNHFKDHFFLEVQAHPDDVQRRHNKMILLMHEKYDIPLIHANDSHYIYEQDAVYRDMYLKAKGIVYEDESNFILDYPSVPTIIKRYKQQGVLSDKQIFDAITNTYIFDECEPIYIDKEFKLPKIIQGDSNKYLKELLLKEWDKKKYKTNPKRRKEYYEAIVSEYKTVVDCGMADYFILNHAIVERAVNEYNAVITRSGRGSAVSFYINNLLGLTEVDRLKAPTKLYPSRFMSAERILATKSMPDKKNLNKIDILYKEYNSLYNQVIGFIK